MLNVAYSRAVTAHSLTQGNDKLASGSWDDVSPFAAPCVPGTVDCAPIKSRTVTVCRSLATLGGRHGDACR